MTNWNVAMAAAASAAAKPQAIPFRQDSAADGATLVGVLAVTVVLLAVLALATWHARRRGWLDRWIGPDATQRGPALRVEQALRLSPRTTLYRVSYEDRLLLVVESTANIRIERGMDEPTQQIAQGGAPHDKS